MRLSLPLGTKARTAAMLLLIAGLVLGASPSDATVPAAPALNSCHNFSYATFYSGASDGSAPVSCAGSYVARTFYVGRLTTNEAYSTLMTDQRIWNAISNSCGRPWIRDLGSNAAVAMTGFLWSNFIPTQRQYIAGARWFRCDAVLPGNGRLYTLPHSLPLAVHITSGIEACLFSSFGHLYGTACEGPHNYRAAGYFAVNSATRPSNSTIIGWATSRCPAITHSTGDKTTAPYPGIWADGVHLVTCYKPDRY